MKICTVFPRLDALHIWDASALFHAGWSDVICFRRLQNSMLKIMPMLLLMPDTQHTICWLTPRHLIEEIRYSNSEESLVTCTFPLTKYAFIDNRCHCKITLINNNLFSFLWENEPRLKQSKICICLSLSAKLAIIIKQTKIVNKNLNKTLILLHNQDYENGVRNCP